MPGSKSPARVPITSPSSGVMPMLVSTLQPCSIAVTLAPLPKWQETIRNFSAATFSSAATAFVTCAWLMPWKP
jgi:hypothetical protein